MTDIEDAKQPTFTDKGVEYPLYPFDVPASIKLPNNTAHHFRMWNEVTEKKREDAMKTVVLTSPAIINGENPRDVKTDYTRSALLYYEMMIERVSGVALNGSKPEDEIDARQTVEGQFLPDGKAARVIDLIGVPVRKAAAARLYGGKIEVERLEDDEDDDDSTGDPFADADITKAVEKAEKPREIYTLTLNRNVIVRQELGIEQLRSGQITKPINVIRYHFREPMGEDFSKWELKAYGGFAVSRPKGGERSERYYNLDTMRTLFDNLIESIDGASINGRAIDLSPNRDDAGRKTALALVPLSIKKVTVATLFSELSNLGNF